MTVELTKIQKSPRGILSGNILKIIALIAMTVDHIGLELMNDNIIFRIVGRLAFPIFAFMIAEGCVYTRSRGKYLFKIAALALICQAAYYFAMNSLYMCILVTFSLSVCLIYLYDYMVKKQSTVTALIFLLALISVYLICEALPRALIFTDFNIDYGFFGVMVPLLIYIGKDKLQKLILCALGLISLSVSLGQIQWFCLLALVPLALYSGERGKARIKNLFYIYYPAHLLLIYLVNGIIF